MLRARCVAVAWLTVVVVVALASPAAAGTASVKIDGDSATLVYRAAPGEFNRLTLSPDETGQLPVTYRFYDHAGVRAGAGCEPAARDPARRVRCRPPQATELYADVRVGDAHDHVKLTNATGVKASVLGGVGNDTITGPGGPGSRFDDYEPTCYYGAWPPVAAIAQLDPAPGSVLSGGPGRDYILGGSGGDVIDPGPGVDCVAGYGGDDRVRAVDEAFDVIECDRGRDRLVLGRLDLATDGCGGVRRRGAPVAVPLEIETFWEDLEQTYIRLGCPADMPGPCKGTVRLAIRGGAPVFRARFRVRPGRVGGPTAYLTSRANRKLAARGGTLSVRSNDGAGRVRTNARRLYGTLEPDQEDP